LPKDDEGDVAGSNVSTGDPNINDEVYSDAVSEFSLPDNANLLSRMRESLECVKRLCFAEDASFCNGGMDSGVVLSHQCRSGNDHGIMIAKGKLFIPNWYPRDLAEVSDRLLRPARRAEWDSDVLDCQELSTIGIGGSWNECLMKTYASFKGRFGFPGRDFIWHVYSIVESDHFFHINVSLEDEDEDLSRKLRDKHRMIRGNTVLGGFCLKLVQGGTEIYMINQTDLKAGRAVPDWILDSVVKRSPCKLVAIKKFIMS